MKGPPFRNPTSRGANFNPPPPSGPRPIPPRGPSLAARNAPPRRLIPAAGETWFIQATTGRALLTVEVIEATRRTVLLMQVCDGSIKPKSDAVALRYRISDFKWIEQVPQ